jgi:hypothetical protein
MLALTILIIGSIYAIKEINDNFLSFDQLRDAVRECTSYDLVQRFSDDEDEYVLIDPYGDVDGDPFYDLDDVVDFITNNADVEAYLSELN